MPSRKTQRRANSHHPARTRPSTDKIVVGLVNSVAITVGGVYELTGSPVVAAVAGGLAGTVVGVAVGLHR